MNLKETRLFYLVIQRLVRDDKLREVLVSSFFRVDNYAVAVLVSSFFEFIITLLLSRY